MSVSTNEESLEEIEIRLLLEGVFRQYGYDFRDYAFGSLRRRVGNILREEKLKNVSALQERVLHDPEFLERFIASLAVNVSSMFRDPNFFLAFRTKVVPLLRTYPFVRIWQAGCSKGEEVYSLAILLEEEGLYERCRIYATDLSTVALKEAKEGIYPLDMMQRYTKDYIDAGGTRSFSEYYTAAYDHAIIRPSLKANIVFSQHNLVTDTCFNEFNVILCRNVMIYFNRKLQEQVHRLLYDSLAPLGFLGLGDRESVRLSIHEKDYERFEVGHRLYRRIN